MPSRVVKQPNGKYAIFSTVVEDFVAYDCTAKGNRCCLDCAPKTRAKYNKLTPYLEGHARAETLDSRIDDLSDLMRSYEIQMRGELL